MPLQPEPHFPPPGRPPSARPDLVLLRDPVLVTQGTEYLLVSWALGELTARLVPGARLSLNQGIGHQPFVESPERFNRELAEFVQAANRC